MSNSKSFWEFSGDEITPEEIPGIEKDLNAYAKQREELLMARNKEKEDLELQEEIDLLSQEIKDLSKEIDEITEDYNGL